jgi:hypothetical protein
MGRVCTDADAQAAIDRIIEHGEYIRDAAKALNVDYSSMLRKLATPEFKPLADEARMGAAEAQERLAFSALQAIQSGDDQALVTRQVRLSEHHWKSAKVRDPRSYGDKVAHDVTNSGAITIKVMHFGQDPAPLTIDADTQDAQLLPEKSTT